jgi:hypothetical protein
LCGRLLAAAAAALLLLLLVPAPARHGMLWCSALSLLLYSWGVKPGKATASKYCMVRSGSATQST